MTKPEKTIAIDIRLLGKKRTGDEMVFFHLTKEVLKIASPYRFVLLTDEANAQTLSALAARLGCADNSQVSIISLPAKNRFVWNLWSVPKFLFQNPIDVFHTQYILPAIFPRRTKMAVHIHDVSFRAYPKLIGWKDRFFLWLLIPCSLRRASRILVPSQFTKDEIVKYYGTQKDKIAVVPNSIGEEFLVVSSHDTERERVLREKYHLPEHFIIAVGTLQPRKNIPFLIEVFAMLRKKLPEWRLVLVGNRNAHHVDPDISRTLAADHLEEHVIFPGFVDQADLPYVIRMATAFVFPSLYEGFGIPMLEAMSQGVPVAAADIPSLREVGGEAALYFDPKKNPESLAKSAEKLYTLCIDQKYRQALQLAGEERIRHYSWQKSAKLLLDTYSGIA